MTFWKLSKVEHGPEKIQICIFREFELSLAMLHHRAAILWKDFFLYLLKYVENQQRSPETAFEGKRDEPEG